MRIRTKISCLALTIIFMLSSFGTMVSMATDVIPAFDLDLSTGTWKDQSKNNITDIWYVNSAKRPKVETMDSLNGTTSYLNFANSNAIVFNGSTFANSDDLTIEMWAYVGLPTSFPDMFGISSGTIGDCIMGAEFFLWNSAYRVWYNGTDTAVSKDCFDKWSHYVFTRKWDAATKSVKVSVYIDGMQIHTDSLAKAARPSTTGKHLYIGNVGTGGESFAGKLTAFKVYTSVLDAATILAHCNNEKNSYTNEPVEPPHEEPDPNNPEQFHMSLSDYDGTNNISDATRNITDIWFNDVNKKPSVGSMKTAKGTTKYLMFDGSNAIAVNGSTFANSDELTVETWAYINTPTEYPDMFGISSGNIANSIMGAEFYNWQGTYTMWYNQTDTTSIGKKYFDKWTHYVFTRKWDNTTKKVIVSAFADGKQIDAKAWDATERPATAGMNLYIGNSGTSGNIFSGNIATMQVYNTLLDSNTIQANYQDQLPAFTKAYFELGGVEQPERNTDTLSIALYDSVEFTSLQVKNIMVTCKDTGKVLKSTLENYNQENGTADIRIYEYLNEEANYRIDISGLVEKESGATVSSYFQFQAKPYDITAVAQFYNAQGDIITQLRDTNLCKANVKLKNQTEQAKTCEVIMVMYDNHKIAKSISMKQVSLASKEQAEGALDDMTVEEGSSAVIYILDISSQSQSVIQIVPKKLIY